MEVDDESSDLEVDYESSDLEEGPDFEVAHGTLRKGILNTLDPADQEQMEKVIDKPVLERLTAFMTYMRPKYAIRSGPNSVIESVLQHFATINSRSNGDIGQGGDSGTEDSVQQRHAGDEHATGAPDKRVETQIDQSPDAGVLQEMQDVMNCIYQVMEVGPGGVEAYELLQSVLVDTKLPPARIEVLGIYLRYIAKSIYAMLRQTQKREGHRIQPNSSDMTSLIFTCTVLALSAEQVSRDEPILSLGELQRRFKGVELFEQLSMMAKRGL